MPTIQNRFAAVWSGTVTLTCSSDTMLPTSSVAALFVCGLVFVCIEYPSRLPPPRGWCFPLPNTQTTPPGSGGERGVWGAGGGGLSPRPAGVSTPFPDGFPLLRESEQPLAGVRAAADALGERLDEAVGVVD